MYASFSGRVHCCCPAHIASAFVRLRRNAAADHWVGRMAERVHNAMVDVPLELYERWAAMEHQGLWQELAPPADRIDLYHLGVRALNVQRGLVQKPEVIALPTLD